MKTGSENNAQEGRQKRAKFEISLFLIKFFFIVMIITSSFIYEKC